VFPLADEDLALYTAVLNALQAVENINAAYLVVYTSLLVETINDVYSNENDNNRWRVYVVNGVHAYISADPYTLKDGDQIEWTYQKY
jgi:ribonuclease HI